MWSLMVVIHPPSLDLAPRILDRQELLQVQKTDYPVSER
jgi:hypothetical protein